MITTDMRAYSRLFLLAIVFVSLFMLHSSHAHAAVGINPQINFQGKLANPNGTNVTDGTYSIVFSLYSVASGGSNVWTETQGSVSVADGIFQVSLGSVTTLPASVDFNSDSLYLGIKVGADLEMTPRIRFTASPYAFNSNQLNGLSKGSFTQLAQGVQADSSTTNSSIFINKTGATAKILELQNNGTDVFDVNNDGSVLSQNSTNSTSAFQIQNATGAIALAVDTTSLNTLLSNGGMEGTSNTSWALKAGTGSVSRDTTQQYSGLASEKVALTSTAIGDGAKYTVNTTLAATTQYTATFTLKQTAGTAFTTNLQVGFNSGADTACTTLTPTLTNQPVPTTGWARYTCVFTSDASPAASDTLYWKELDAPGVARTFFIDSVQLELGAVGSPFKETGLSFNGVISSPVAFKNTNDSAAAFIVQNSSAVGLFIVDTLNARVYIGDVIADSTGVLLVLDTKNTAGDPTGVNGGSYYNSNVNKNRCFENSIWYDCVDGFNTLTKTVDQQAPLSSVAMNNDNTLFFAMNANTTYVVTAYIPIDDSNATADMSYTFTTPAGATLDLMTDWSSAAITSTICNITASAQVCSDSNIFNSAAHYIRVNGFVANAGTAGNLQFQFTQRLSTAAAFPVIKKGATLTWHQSN